MTLHLSLPGHQQRNQAEQQQEVREARRLLKERIRNDWEYPTLPEWSSSGRNAGDDVEAAEARIAGFRFHTPNDQDRVTNGSGEVLGLDFDPVDWRDREYSSNDDSDEDGKQKTPSSATSIGSKASVSRFDSPDSVGAQLVGRRLAKKRKRLQALEQEMSWNDGLLHWMRRRDEWCCARTLAEVNIIESCQIAGNAGSSSASASSSPRTSTSSTVAQDHSTPGSSPSTTPDIGEARPAASRAVVAPTEVLVPVAPALLPDHPVRRRITPNLYPEIYAKIILQSRSPSVPINLQTLITAIVQGWKDDGEWPPKPGPQEKSIGRKKGSHSGGVKDTVKRILRVTCTNDNAKG